MNKLRIVSILGSLALLFSATGAEAAVTFPINGGTGSSSPSGILVGQGTSPVATLGIGAGLSLTGTTLANSIGYPFPGNATTTSLTFGGNQVFTNTPTFSFLGAGTVNSTAAGTLYNTATSTPTVTAPITYSGTLGQFIGGVSGAFDCIAATGSVKGCLTAADWTTFNNKQPAGNYITALTGDVTASGPGSVVATLKNTGPGASSYTNSNITIDAQGRITAASNGTGGTGTGLSTSSPVSAGNLLEYSSSGSGSAFGVATTSVTCSGSTTCTPFTAIGSSPITISSTGGSGSPGGASSTIQYNANGAFAGNAGLTYDGTNLFLPTLGTTTQQKFGLNVLQPIPYISSTGQVTTDPSAFGYDPSGHAVFINAGDLISPNAGTFLEVGHDMDVTEITGANDIGFPVYTATGQHGTYQNPTNNLSGETLGQYRFNAVTNSATSATFKDLAAIGGLALGSVTQHLGGGLAFYTSADGDTTSGTSTPTERARIDQNGNLGIGTSTPTATLSVNAAAQTNPYFAIGSTSAPVMTVSPSATPTVGIGTSSPSTTRKLTVVGPTYIEDSTASALIVGSAGTSTNAFQVDQSAGVGTGMSIQTQVPGSGLTLQTLSGNAAENLSLLPKAAGSVTIGNTTSGTSVLNVGLGGTWRVSVGGTVTDNLGGTNTFGTTAGNGAATTRFLHTGAVDLALTAATEAPDVYFNEGQIRTSAIGAIATQRDIRFTGSTHAFQTGGTIAQDTIASSSAVSIDGPSAQGANANYTNTYGLFVGSGSPFTTASTTSAYGIGVYAPTGATNNYALFTHGNVLLESLSAGAGNGALCATTAGLVQYDAGANCIVSTQKAKHDILTITDAQAQEILDLRPVQYTYNDGSGTRFGFIAEEVAKIDPKLVIYAQSDMTVVGVDGKPAVVKKGDPYTVDYTRMIGLLTAEVQRIAQTKGMVPVRSVEENWQWYAIGGLSALLLLMFGWMISLQMQIIKLKK